MATRVTDGPRIARRSASAAGRVDRRGVEAVGRGQGDDVGAVRRAEQLLEALARATPRPAGGTRRCRRRRCRRRRSADRQPRSCRAVERAAVVEEGDVADEGDGRRPAEGDAEGGGDHAVDAVGAAVGVGDRRRPAEPLEVAHRHRRGDDEAGAVGKLLGDRAGDAGLGQRGFGGQEVGDRLLGVGAAPDPVGGPLRRAGLHGGELGEGVDRRTPGGRRRHGDRGRSTPGPPTWTRVASLAAIHVASTFDAAGRPMRTTTSGRCAAANSLDAQHGVEGGDGTGEVTAARRRVGEHRPAGRRRQPCDVVGRHAAAPAGEDQPTLGVQQLCDADDGYERRSLSVVATGTTVARWQLADLAEERLAERQVEVHRASRCRGDAPAAERPPAAGGGRIGNTRVVEPAHRAAVQVGLVDRLRCADVAQLRWTVGGDDEHRDVGQPAFDDGRMEVGRGRAARAQQHGGAAVEPEAEGDERRRPARRGRRAARSSVALGEGQRHRRAARSGGDDGVADAVADPLVDERGAERRLDVGRAHLADQRSRSVAASASATSCSISCAAGSSTGEPQQPGRPTTARSRTSRAILLPPAAAPIQRLRAERPAPRRTSGRPRRSGG